MSTDLVSDRKKPINEVDVIEALCELVKIAPDRDTARRRLESAKQCYEIAIRVLSLELRPEQAHEFRNRLNRVKLWLDSAGNSLVP